MTGGRQDSPPEEGLLVSTFPPGAEWASKAGRERQEAGRGRRYASCGPVVSSQPLGQKRETGTLVLAPTAGETGPESSVHVQDE